MTVKNVRSLLLVVAAAAMAATSAVAVCNYDAGVRLVNGTSGSVSVTVTDSCNHVANVNVPSGQSLTVPVTHGSVDIVWSGVGSSGENTPDLWYGQVYVQQL